MGPFVVVQGPDPAQTEFLFCRAVELFGALANLHPADTVAAPTLRAACFPQSSARRASRFHRCDGRWMGAAGVWLYRGIAGLEGLDALGRQSGDAGRLPTELQHADGQFALVTGDDAGTELALATDRVGSLHLYTIEAGACLVASTSSLVLAALTRPPWDPVGVRHFLATGTIFEQRTLFAGIEKLEPATVFRYRDGRLVSRHKYWDIAAVAYDRAPSQGDAAQLAGALIDTMTAIGRNFPRPLIDLTGGFDSRAVVGAMRRAGGGFHTVVNGDERHPDVVAANRIAAELGLPHIHHRPGHRAAGQVWETAKEALAYTDGEYDVLLYQSVLEVQRALARREFDACVSGSNGEICKGYWWELLFPFTGSRNHFDSRKVAEKRFVYDGEETGLLAFEFPDSLGAHFAGIIDRATQPLARHPNTAKLDTVYLTLRMQRWQGRIASASLRIWPCLCPFLFRAPMEVALSARPSLRMRHRMVRRLIEHLDPQLAALPLEYGYPASPLRWSNLPAFAGPVLRCGFSKAATRLRRLFGGRLTAPAPRLAIAEFWALDQVRELLDPGAMRTRELYRPQALASWLEASRAPGFGGTARFGRILTLEMVARTVAAGARL